MVAPSLELINRYLTCVFGYLDGWVALRSYAEAGQQGKSDMEWVSVESEDVAKAIHDFAITANNAKRACYLIPGTVTDTGKASASDVCQFGTVLVDIDNGDTLAKLVFLTEHIGAPNMVIESGGITETDTPKMHCYWQLSEPAESDDIKLVLRLREMIALKAGGDSHFKSAHQPIRIAGSIYHKKSEPRLVSIRAHKDGEYHLGDLVDAVDTMPMMEGIEAPKQGALDWQNFNDTKPSVGEVLITTVHEGGKDAYTRFEALSAAMGYFLRRHHEGLLSWDDTWAEIHAFNQLKVSPPWDDLRLKKEIDRLWKKHCDKYGQAKLYNPPSVSNSSLFTDITSYRLADILDNPPAIPQDIIGPRVLTPGGMLLFAGAPKVGKSDFLLSMFIHFAAGEPFLDFVPRGPLRIFYLQMEIQGHYVAERIANLSVGNDTKQRAAENLFITPRLKMLLNEDGVNACVRHIKEKFGKTLPDIIAIDPLRNVFDGGDHGNENDNNAMLFFLQERTDKLRDSVNPDAGIVIVHHTKKVNKNQFKDEPFQALSGANALRGYYDTGMLLFRPDEAGPKRELICELRNGPEVPPLEVEKRDGAWHGTTILNSRLTRQTQGQREDAERERKDHTIIDIIREQALLGNVFVLSTFAEKFRGKHGLGGRQTLKSTIMDLATQGKIKFRRDLPDKSFSKVSSKWGYLIVRDMELQIADGELVEVFPTHYRNPHSGHPTEVENPKIWVTQEEFNDEN